MTGATEPRRRVRSCRRVAGGLVRGLVPMMLVVGLAGCGGSDPTMSAEAGRQLNADVSAVRAAASANSRNALAAAAAALRAHVTEQQAAGHLSAERANAILAQLNNVLADIAATAPAASPAAKPTPTLENKKQEPERDDRHGKGRSDDHGDSGGDGGGDGGGD